MSLNELGKEIHQNAKEKGFYEDIEHVMSLLRDEPKARGFVYKLWLSNRLMLIVSECAEALEAIRDGNFSHVPKSGGFYEELADATIRIADLVASERADLDGAIRLKMGFNSTREKRHGGKAL